MERESLTVDWNSQDKDSVRLRQRLAMFVFPGPWGLILAYVLIWFFGPAELLFPWWLKLFAVWLAAHLLIRPRQFGADIGAFCGEVAHEIVNRVQPVLDRLNRRAPERKAAQVDAEEAKPALQGFAAFAAPTEAHAPMRSRLASIGSALASGFKALFGLLTNPAVWIAGAIALVVILVLNFWDRLSRPFDIFTSREEALEQRDEARDHLKSVEDERDLAIFANERAQRTHDVERALGRLGPQAEENIRGSVAELPEEVTQAHADALNAVYRREYLRVWDDRLGTSDSDSLAPGFERLHHAGAGRG